MAEIGVSGVTAINAVIFTQIMDHGFELFTHIGGAGQFPIQEYARIKDSRSPTAPITDIIDDVSRNVARGRLYMRSREKETDCIYWIAPVDATAETTTSIDGIRLAYFKYANIDDDFSLSSQFYGEVLLADYVAGKENSRFFDKLIGRYGGRAASALRRPTHEGTPSLQ